ncbi:MAG: NAD(P)/FAD-dependent oxidoreductase [Candidatus Eremiobacteraeota bacterium]|nr:NAD(P)/FAD-dependent oxidoreductase [Candidatus Eremiobacteraeota bacterium]
MQRYDVAVVGAGHNGLACAALLAKAGLSVAVFERSDRIGGAAVSESMWNGYTVSAASYVCTLLDPWVISELELERHGYHAYRKDPSNFSVLEDGRSLLLGSGDEANEREIAAFDRADVDGYSELDTILRRLGSELFETFSEEWPSFDAFSPRTQEMLQGSAADLVERYVQTPVLQAAIATDGIIGTYRGPRDAGTGYVLAHHYAGRALGVQGAWGYVRGGMGAISNALASAAKSHGATIHSSSPVAAIHLFGGEANGVVLQDGTEIRANVIVSNAHPQTTYLELVGERSCPPEITAALKQWDSIGASFKVNLALGELPNFTARPGAKPMPHHRASIHIAPSIDYVQTAYDDARRHGKSQNPMLECFLQTPTDPTLAPHGKHILSIFAQYYAYDKPGGWTTRDEDQVAEEIVSLVGRVAPNVPNAVEARQVLSPAGLEKRIGLIGGHIFHGELLPGQIFEKRFATRTPIRNLYLCGSGAHPGGCVSGFPGKRAAAAILADVKQLTHS